jgi:uncharacterized membrane-anchored protein
LAHTFAPWQSLYSGSTLVATSVTTMHIVAMLVGGGLAIAADRSTLRSLPRPAEQGHLLRELKAVHRPVVIWLAVLFVTGAMLAAADVETFAASPIFWVKLALIALLLVNGAQLYRTEARLSHALPDHAAGLDRLWRRLGRSARLSLGLWVLITILGVVLTNG